MRFQYINKQIVAGFIGKDIELRYMPSGDAVLDVSVATTNSWKDKQGEWHDDTEWHNCIFYRKQAEEAAAVLSKGTAVYVEGRTFSREWEAQDNSKRRRKEIIVDTFHVIHHVRNEKVKDDAPSGADTDNDALPPKKNPPTNKKGDTPPSNSNMAGFDQP